MKIIAEIGINYDAGNWESLKHLINQAKIAKVDGIKIQYLKSSKMYSKDYDYIGSDGKKIKIKSYLKKYEIPKSWLSKLKKLTNELNLIFVCTVCDIDSVKEVEPYIDIYKVSSSSSNFVQLHREINLTRKHVVVSLGGSTLLEVQNIINIYNSSNLTILHCNYTYPTSYNHVNLLYLKKLKVLNKRIGFSDHTLDYKILGSMCVIMGCDYYEKHITIDRKAIGPDHLFSLNIEELSILVQNVREAEMIIGIENKSLYDEELELKEFAYRKAFANNTIASNSKIRKEDIIWLRNGTEKGDGFDPKEEYLIENKITKNEIKKGNKILKEDLWR